MAKAPYRRTARPREVWTLICRRESGPQILGQFSTEAKAESAAYRVITAESGATLGRPPAWTSDAAGKILAYARGAQSWWLTVRCWPIDGELV